MLTIAIPTYNRNKILKVTVEAIVKQLQPSCRLLIIDNTSPIPAAETLAETIAPVPPEQIRLVRNAANVGASANVLRCLELCETPWLWILGDDDKVHENAVATILKAIQGYPKAIYMGFSSNLAAIPQARVGAGTTELISQCPSFQNLLFISSGIYNAEAVKKKLLIGYEGLSSWGGHTCVMLRTVDREGAFAFLPDCIADSQLPDDPEQRYAYMEFLPRAPLLAEYGTTNVADKAALTRLISRAFKALEFYTINLLIRAKKQKSSRESIHLYRVFCGRFFAFERSPIMNAKILLYRLLFISPSLSLGLLKIALLLKGQSHRLTDDKWGER